MQRDWDQYGASYFTFQQVEVCDESDLDDLEFYYIQAYKTFEYGYNATEDGRGKCDYNHKSTVELSEYDESESEIEASVYHLTEHVEQSIEIPSVNPPVDITFITNESKPSVAQLDKIQIKVTEQPPAPPAKRAEIKPPIEIIKPKQLAQSKVIPNYNAQKSFQGKRVYINHKAKNEVIKSNNEALFVSLEAQGLLILQKTGSIKVRCSRLLERSFGRFSHSNFELFNQTRKLKDKLNQNNHELSDSNIKKVSQLIRQIEKRLQ